MNIVDVDIDVGHVGVGEVDEVGVVDPANFRADNFRPEVNIYYYYNLGLNPPRPGPPCPTHLAPHLLKPCAKSLSGKGMTIFSMHLSPLVYII